MNNRTFARWLASTAFLIMFVIAWAFYNPVQAQTLKWTVLDEVCAGEPIMRDTGKTNPACKERDMVAQSMIRQGWLPAAHGVWLSPAQQAWFSAVLNRMDAQARDNIYATDSLMPMLLTELRRKLTDEQIFAIWNEQRPAIQAYAPFGSAIMTTMMQKLALIYARSNNVRYRLEP